ncbi:HNH endonuclease [Erythrobacter sp. W53]|uniref:HNH endonuclease n=1 Tax=Erythrobacter sp. W53 TaxID=3425947 RepID=UPI003D7675F2
MFKAELMEKAAHFRSTQDDPTRSLSACPSLVLNADYTPLSYYPLSLWPWQTAIKAIFLDRVDVIETYDREVHSPSLDIKIPSVIALKQYVKPSEFPAFTRFNLFLRDQFQCQYCGSGGGKGSNLTFDHVIPRRLGGKTTWENITAACAPCNMKKGGRTPEQAHMRLARQPIRPTHWQLQEYGKKFPPNHLHETWMDWLYWDIELQE